MKTMKTMKTMSTERAMDPLYTYLDTSQPDLFVKALKEAQATVAKPKMPFEEAYHMYLQSEDFIWLGRTCARASEAPVPANVTTEWLNFMTDPTVENAIALCAGVKINGSQRSTTSTSITTATSKSTLQHHPSIKVKGGGRKCPTDTKMPFLQLQEEYKTLMAMDTLHDLTLAKIPLNIRQGLVNRIFPRATIEEARSFVNERVAFNKKATGFLQGRLGIMPRALALQEVQPYLMTAEALSLIGKTVGVLRSSSGVSSSGVLEIVMDGIVKRTDVTFRNGVLAAYVLLLLKDMFEVTRVPDENEVRVIPTYKKEPNAISAITKITFLDGSFMAQDGLSLVHFVTKYIKTVKGVTGLNVSIDYSLGHASFFKKYTRPGLVTVEHVVKMPRPFAIGLSEIYTFENWHLPYPKDALIDVVEQHWASTDPAIAEKLDDIMALNFLRDAHRIDLACRRNALLVTTDGIALHYMAWIKKHHPNVKAPALHLNIIQSGTGTIQAVNVKTI